MPETRADRPPVFERTGSNSSRVASVPSATDARMIAVVLKGYPRLSETFIAQELLALERRGLSLALYSLRRPTDAATHPLHVDIKAPVTYLPEYLHEDIGRVLRGWRRVRATGERTESVSRSTARSRHTSHAHTASIAGACAYASSRQSVRANSKHIGT